MTNTERPMSNLRWARQPVVYTQLIALGAGIAAALGFHLDTGTAAAIMGALQAAGAGVAALQVTPNQSVPQPTPIIATPPPSTDPTVIVAEITDLVNRFKTIVGTVENGKTLLAELAPAPVAVTPIPQGPVEIITPAP